MTDRPQIIFCRCAYSDIIPDNIKNQILCAIEDSNIPFQIINDLCEVSAKKDPRLKKWAQQNIKIVACFDRAVRSLFHSADAPLKDDVLILNMRIQSAEDILTALTVTPSARIKENQNSSENQPDWIPWFPVIDNTRCTNCKQCLNFCLFGVYSLSDTAKVQVTKPANCKTNCPACARVCPNHAIIFPKYPDSPINGDNITEDTDTAAPVDINKILGDNIHDAIRNRNKTQKRFSKNKPRIADLQNLKDKLNIPDSVIKGLNKNTRVKHK